MCEPTPTSTVFSTSSSTIYQTITTSSAIVITPQPIISTVFTSSCTEYRGQVPSDVPAPRPSAPEIEPSVSSGDEERDGRNRGERAQGWGRNAWVESGTSIVENTPTEVQAIALNALPSATSSSLSSSAQSSSTTSSSSSTVSSVASSFSTDGRISSRPAQTWEVGSAFRFRQSGASALSSTKGPHLKSHLPTPRAAHKPHKGLNRRQQQCVSWTTVSSETTIYPEPITSWATEIITTSSVESARVPVQTSYASCTVEAVVGIQTSQAASSSEQQEQTVQQQELQVSSEEIAQSTTTQKQVQPVQQEQATRSSMQRFADTPHTSSSASHTAGPGVSSSVVVFASDTMQRQNAPTTVSRDTNTNTLANANEPPHSTPSQREKAQPSGASETTQTSKDHASSTHSRGASAGAAVGGVLGLLVLLAAMMFLLRWWRLRKREERTRELRSSWSYGGDVAEHHHDNHNDDMSEKNVPLQSRFSAPSLISRNSARVSRSVPAFLALPINQIRQSSGRFPAVLNDLRKSWSAPKEHSGTPAWATKYGFDTIASPPPPVPVRLPNDTLRPTDTSRPPVPPVSVRTVEDALAASADVLVATRSPLSPPSTTIKNLHVTNPDLQRETSFRQDPPRLDMTPIGGTTLAWGHSYSPQDTNTPTTSSSESMERLQPTRTSPHTQGFPNGVPLESYYSVYSAMSEQTHDQPLPYHLNRSNSHEAQQNIGQAISAPGRESIEVSQFPLPPKHRHMSENGSTIRFPTPSIMVRPPSNARNLTPQPTVVPDNLPLPTAPYLGRVGDRSSAGTTENRSMGGRSSIFEYSEYNNDPKRESHMTTNTARATRNWYDKPIWDTNPVSGISGSLYDPRSTAAPSTYGGVSTYAPSGYGGDATISRASRASRASAHSAMSDNSGVWTVGGTQGPHVGVSGGGHDGQGRKSRGKSVRWGDAEEEPLPRVFELARAL